MLLSQLFVCYQQRIHNVFEIIDTIRDLEGEGARVSTKPAGRFRKLPLRGLWHKHFFSANYLLPNLILEMNKASFLDDLTKILDPSKNEYLTEDLIGRVTHHATVGLFNKRSREQRMTGEWIVFMKRPDGNRYLSLAMHGEGDHKIFHRITANCAIDFPELKLWIGEARRKI